MLTFIYFSIKKNSRLKHLIQWFGLIQTILVVLNFTWFLKINAPSETEILLFNSMFLVAQVTVLVIFLGYLSQNKNLFFLIFLYLFAALSLHVSFQDFFVLIEFISFLILLLGFMTIINRESKYLMYAGILGVIYSSLSMAFVFILYFLKMKVMVLHSLMNLFLIFAMYHILLFFKSATSAEIAAKDTVLKRILNVVKLVIEVAVILVICVISVISIHELGHAVAASHYDCEMSKAVIYDGKHFPHTEIECSTNAYNTIILLSGLFLPVILGAVLMLLGESFLEDIAYLVLGMSFYFSNKDILDLGLTQNFVVVITIVSFVFLYMGIKGLVTHMSD